FKKEEIEKLKEINIEVMIKGLFKKNGDDYDKPTKESLIKIIGELKEFSKNFRAEDVIDKHYTEIMMLINKLR
ncbi:hypothetical protein KKB58_00440, partial [Patescibacteria group bacterium]|nr:hypothetical protein [Patescibacteria group bacterium]